MEFYIDDPVDENTNEIAELHGIEREYNRLKDNVAKVFCVEKSTFEIAKIETSREI